MSKINVTITIQVLDDDGIEKELHTLSDTVVSTDKNEISNIAEKCIINARALIPKNSYHPRTQRLEQLEQMEKWSRDWNKMERSMYFPSSDSPYINGFRNVNNTEDMIKQEAGDWENGKGNLGIVKDGSEPSENTGFSPKRTKKPIPNEKINRLLAMPEGSLKRNEIFKRRDTVLKEEKSESYKYISIIKYVSNSPLCRTAFYILTTTNKEISADNVSPRLLKDIGDIKPSYSLASVSSFPISSSMKNGYVLEMQKAIKTSIKLDDNMFSLHPSSFLPSNMEASEKGLDEYIASAINNQLIIDKINEAEE